MSNRIGRSSSIMTRSLSGALLLGCLAIMRPGLAQEPLVQITSPPDGSVVNPGQAVSVVVTPADGVTLTQVAVIGENPIGFGQLATTAPFQVSVTIPSSMKLGAYHLVAVATAQSGPEIYSDPITIDVERPDTPSQIVAMLPQITFEAQGEQLPLRIQGTFADGSSLDITESSSLSYSSSDTTVATVDHNGIVTAVAAGSVTVTATYGQGGEGPHVTIPVTVPTPVLSSAPTSLSFSDQSIGTTSPEQTLILTNDSNGPLTVLSVEPTGEFAESDTCVNTSPLDPGGTCTINVTFTPSANGTTTGALDIANSFNVVPLTVPLTGTGTGTAARLSMAPSSLSFSGQIVGTTSSAQAITLTNTGNGTSTFGKIAAAGDFAIATSGTTCTTANALPAGAKCAVAVTFTPTSGGNRAGSVTFTDIALGSPQVVMLTGVGQDFGISAASGSSSSATVTPGQSATYKVSLSPLGGFSQVVSLACSGAPSESGCTISPSSVTLSGSTASTATVTVTTTAASAGPPGLDSSPRTRGPGSQRSPIIWLLTLSALAAISLTGRRRRWLALVVAGGIVAFSLACGGSGGGGGGGGRDPGTPLGTYTLTVMGSATPGTANLQHFVTLTLRVD